MDGGLSHLQPLGHLAIGHSLLKPLLQDSVQSAGDGCRTSRGLASLQAIQTVRLETRFPAALGGHGMLKGLRELLLRGQIPHPQLNRRIAKTQRVGKGKAKEWLLPLKDHPHPGLIHEREVSVDPGPRSPLILLKVLKLVKEDIGVVDGIHPPASPLQRASLATSRDASDRQFIP